MPLRYVTRELDARHDARADKRYFILSDSSYDVA